MLRRALGGMLNIYTIVLAVGGMFAKEGSKRCVVLVAVTMLIFTLIY